MGKAFVLGIASLVLVACQPMYGAKPEKMRMAIRDRRDTKIPTDDIPAGPTYVETCTVDFQKAAPKTGIKRDTRSSAKLVGSGDTTITTADATADVAQRADLVRESIDRYSGALVRDPFNAEATLKLALAYDRVYRKGCALALLKRLVALAGNQLYEPDATANINRVDDNKQWFKGYRTEALRAIGH
jgi:hypothetical protein